MLILTKIPLFVWPLFLILLLGGLKARKTSCVPLALLLIVPTLFFSGSLLSFFGKYTDSVSMLLWIFCLGVVFLIGFLHMQKLNLQFDKKKRKVVLPGSWVPLMLAMSIFTAKFSIGIMGAIVPHMNPRIFLGLELFATIILGIFAGRGINCLLRYKATAVI